MVIDSNLQLLKAPCPILVICAGNVTDVSDVQLRNTSVGNSVTPSGMVNAEDKLVHP